jgi:hypothetical protein
MALSRLKPEPPIHESRPIVLEVGDTVDVALGAGHCCVAREAGRITESHDIRMREEPGLLSIVFGVVTRVAVIPPFTSFVGFVARRATVAVVFERGNRMVGFVPAFRVWQLDTVTRGTEIRLDVAGGARLSAFAVDDTSMGGGPGVALNTARMVTRVAVAARFPDLCGSVTRSAAVSFGFLERRCVPIFVPALGVGHLKAVAGIAELLLLVTGRAGWIRIGETDPVAPGPTWVDVARWPGNHREWMAGRAGQRSDGIDAVAIEARVHGGFDGPLVNVCLNRMARAATDGVGSCLMFGVIKDQSLGTVARPARIEIDVAF